MSEQVTPGAAGRPLSPQQPAAHHHPTRRWCAAGGTLLTGMFLLLMSGSAWAAGAPEAPTLDSVINGLRNWLIGLLAAVATLFLTIGGIRYITAGGDPMQVDRAKTALKSAAIGYALAALSPLLVGVLRSIVG